MTNNKQKRNVQALTEYEKFILKYMKFPEEITNEQMASIIGGLLRDLEQQGSKLSIQQQGSLPSIQQLLLERTDDAYHLSLTDPPEEMKDIIPLLAKSVGVDMSIKLSNQSIALQISQKYIRFEQERRGITLNIQKQKYELDSVRLAEFIKEEYPLYTTPDNKTYLFEGAIYEKQTSLELARLVSDEVRMWGEGVWNTSKEKNYLTAVEQLTLVRHTEHEIFESLKDFINFPNGYYDLKNHCFHSQGQSKHFFRQKMGYEYDPAACCPLFEETVESIFEGDTERMSVFQQLFGYFLTYETKIQKAFFFLGSGSNGKSLLIKIMSEVIGKANITNTSLKTLSSKFGYSDLLHKKVMFSTENEMSTFSDTEHFKAVTGGDSVLMEQKHKDSFTTQLTSKVVIALNSMMDTNDTTTGFFRRVFILPFHQQYVEPVPEEERVPGVCYMDVELEDKLMDELPGIFNYAIAGLKILQANNFLLPHSEVCQEAIEAYQMSQQPLPTFFEECFQVTSEGRFSRPELFAVYEDWRSSVNVPVLTYNKRQLQYEFERYLKSLNVGSTATKIRGHYYYKGIEKK